MMEINFNGKNALVTGAGKGIGREIAKTLVLGGAKTFAISRTKADLDSLKAEHPSIQTICIDLTSWENTRNAVKNIGPIDLLVNNAGTGKARDFFELTQEHFDLQFDINVKSLFNVSQVVAKGMVDMGTGGSIVNISSQASQMALPKHAIYCATKGAVDSMTRVMALELGPYKIRTNCVNPTVVMTRLATRYWTEGAVHTEEMLSKIPMGKFAEMSDVVHAVLYLLSDKAAMINGTLLPVEGGAWIC